MLATRKLNTVMNVDEFKEVLVNGLNASIMEGVDKNPANIWASATMNTPTTKMPVVLRVETKPNMPVVRITVHSGMPFFHVYTYRCAPDITLRVYSSMRACLPLCSIPDIH